MTESILSSELLKLYQSYYQSLPNRLETINQHWEAFLGLVDKTHAQWPISEVLEASENSGDQDDCSWAAEHPEELVTLHRLVHNLAGSGATFGLANLSEIATALDVLLQSILQLPQRPSTEKCQQVSALIHRLQTITIPHLDPHNSTFINSRSSLCGQSSELGAENVEARPIFILDSDLCDANILASQLQSFGYQVRLFDTIADLHQAISHTLPLVVLSDLDFVEDFKKAIELSTPVQSPLSWTFPLFVMSYQDDFKARIQAIRAQAEAYFTKPINIWQLVDKVDRFVVHKPSVPYRILIVEDDLALANYYQFILEEAGMHTQIVSNPNLIMESLSESKPDLILMDMYMPECSGMELAAIIRQQETYVSIPITYLSRETNLDKQMVALSFGGDDFLTKPIQPDHLVAAVTSRAQRAQTLRSLMVRDSLTGLLNHSNIKEHLYLEVSRSNRQKIPLSFVMLDIDHFKKINDTYGHLAGDRVIKNLARLLRQRLRKTDLLGRYGGEEFAAILLGTEGDTAVKVMESIRADFAQTLQQLGEHSIAITFSCGIASFPDFMDANDLNDAADRALYQAKHQGRNCTVLAEHTTPQPFHATAQRHRSLLSKTA